MDIVACTDNGYIMPTGVLMQSVCVNNPDVDNVFHIIIDDSVTTDNQHDLEEVVVPFRGKSVIFHLVDVSMFPIFPNNHGYITQACYYRLVLTKILPETINKALYLDGDVIVRHSLTPLWNTDLQNYAVAAATDMSSERIENYNRLKYPLSLGYFNSGVLLINLKYWREHDVINTFFNYMRNCYRDIRLGDQDVLNVVFRDKKIGLPIKYNLQHGFLTKQIGFDYWKYEKELLEARKDPVIVHYTGIDKPWNTYQKFPNPYRHLFYKYQNQTKWKGVRYDKRSWKLRAVNYVSNILRNWKMKKPIESIFIELPDLES